ncbi:MAG: hypothetical protein K2Z81_12995 [Cyanobacteria bacterium]|nr:hypothetical protein [Cyanobacteriota bacterium]
MDGVVQFLSGSTMMAEIGIAVFFFKFWRNSKDRLFAYFAFSFITLAISQIVVFCYGDKGNFSLYGYSVRLIAFALIIVGIVEKNIPQKPK